MSKNISGYKCVKGYTPDELNVLVCALIDKGWTPFGGVSVSSHVVQEDGVLEPGTWTILAQAMVREKE